VRLKETFELFRAKFAQPDGKLIYYVTKDLNPASDIDSYGHAMEAAFLIVEAAEALDFEIESTWKLAKTMVDRTLSVGWDSQYGGMFNEGHFDKPAHDQSKVWWVQAESFNVLRMMAKKYGDPYQSLCDQQWTFIQKFMIDTKNKGWQPTVNGDGSRIPDLKKSDAWTEGYHQGRAIQLAMVHSPNRAN
jgi:mannobiose 2-epimerase